MYIHLKTIYADKKYYIGFFFILLVDSVNFLRLHFFCLFIIFNFTEHKKIQRWCPKIDSFFLTKEDNDTQNTYTHS